MLFKKIIIFLIVLLAFIDSLFSQSKDIQDNKSETKIIELEKKVNDLNDRLVILETGFKAISGLRISGFFDVYISNQKNKPNIFQTRGLELDISHNYSNNFNVAAAVVVNEDSALKAGFIDYTLYGQSVNPRGNIFLEKGVHLQIGQFDIPFGNDWEYFPSPARISFSAPLTTELIMDGGYNDTGIRFLAGFTSLNFSAYILRGMDKKESYGGNSYGGRLGFTPFNNPYLLAFDREKIFEIGVSYIYDVDSLGSKSEEAFAFDFKTRVNFFFLRGEYILRKNILKVEESGYHFTGGLYLINLVDIPIVLYVRYDYYEILNDTTASYDEFSGNDELQDSIKKITVGANLNLSDISYFKLEYSRSFTSDSRFLEDEYFTEKEFNLQLVIRF